MEAELSVVVRSTLYRLEKRGLRTAAYKVLSSKGVRMWEWGGVGEGVGYDIDVRCWETVSY